MTIELISKLLAELGHSSFWGMIQIDYQIGRPILVRKTETIKTLHKGNTHGNRNSSR